MIVSLYKPVFYFLLSKAFEPKHLHVYCLYFFNNNKNNYHVNSQLNLIEMHVCIGYLCYCVYVCTHVCVYDCMYVCTFLLHRGIKRDQKLAEEAAKPQHHVDYSLKAGQKISLNIGVS